MRYAPDRYVTHLDEHGHDWQVRVTTEGNNPTRAAVIACVDGWEAGALLYDARDLADLDRLIAALSKAAETLRAGA